MRVLMVVAAAGLLAGCQANKPLSEMSYTELQQVATEIEKRCNEQGVTRQSPNWGACAQQEVTREQATRAKGRRMQAGIADALGDGLSSIGDGYSRAAASTSTYTPPITCVSTRSPSGSVTTRC